MKNKLMRILSLALVLVSILTLMIPAVSATTTESPKNGSFVRIRHAGSGRYLDVPAEGIGNNGTQLQVWEFAYGNQNQIFRMYETSSGWEIISLQSGKCIEVRNSSHDDYAQVAQWDRHSGKCARWVLVYNTDGTVSFRNKESGKYLNVCGGGNAPNGTKMIQYHNDGTSAMRFYIEVMSNSDVLSATYKRNVKTSDIYWTSYNLLTSNIYNLTDYSRKVNGNYYYPSVGQKFLISAEFLSPATVSKLIHKKAYSTSVWNEIKSALAGDMTEAGIMALMKKLDFGEVPGLGTALGILQTLWNSRDKAKWNDFLNTVTYDAKGAPCGIIVYTYHLISRVSSYGPLNNGTTAWGMRYYITQNVVVEHKSWSGDNFGSVKSNKISGTAGTWYYTFK